MEVELKKTKITSSIINQLNMATIEQIIDFKALGYVIHKKERKILLYDKDSNTLVYCYLIKEFRFVNDSIQIDSSGNREKHFWISLFCGNNRYYKIYNTDRTNENDTKIIFEQVKDKLNNISQIFY